VAHHLRWPRGHPRQGGPFRDWSTPSSSTSTPPTDPRQLTARNR